MGEAREIDIPGFGSEKRVDAPVPLYSVNTSSLCTLQSTYMNIRLEQHPRTAVLLCESQGVYLPES